jgi:hypothetical protein
MPSWKFALNLHCLADAAKVTRHLASLPSLEVESKYRYLGRQYRDTAAQGVTLQQLARRGHCNRKKIQVCVVGLFGGWLSCIPD